MKTNPKCSVGSAPVWAATVLITLLSLPLYLRADEKPHIAGFNALQNNDYDQAIALLTQAIQINPQDVESYNNRGSAYRALGKSDKAMADFSQAIALNLNFELAYENRGSTYLEEGNNAHAIEDETQAIRLDPKDFNAFSFRGIAYFKTGKLKQAIDDFNESLKIQPTAMAYEDRGVADHDMGNDDWCIKDETAAIRLDPKEPAMYLNRGAAYLARHENGLTIADDTKVIELDPQNVSAYANRARAELAEGQSQAAAADVKKASELGSVPETPSSVQTDSTTTTPSSPATPSNSVSPASSMDDDARVQAIAERLKLPNPWTPESDGHTWVAASEADKQAAAAAFSAASLQQHTASFFYTNMNEQYYHAEMLSHPVVGLFAALDQVSPDKSYPTLLGYTWKRIGPAQIPQGTAQEVCLIWPDAHGTIHYQKFPGDDANIGNDAPWPGDLVTYTSKFVLSGANYTMLTTAPPPGNWTESGTFQVSLDGRELDMAKPGHTPVRYLRQERLAASAEDAIKIIQQP